MSRLDIKTASKAQTVVDRLYKDMERRIASSPPGLCPIDMSLTFLQLCHAQSCGKCVPCRIGLGQLAALMGQVLDGTGTMLTIDTIEKTARAIVASADCAIGRDAAQLVLSGFEGFRDDYVNHVQHHRCLASLQNPVPCVSLCPAGVDVPGYVALVREGRYADAVRLIRKDNPMPTACAYICEHPCEARCRRNMVDAPINIRGLKRYAVDHAGNVPNPACGEATGKRVAIIGGGPSGLSCAYYLRLMGHSVTIFEEKKRLGGMLRYGIPAYRFPREKLDAEIASILSTGVEVHTEVTVGKDISFEQLHKDYDCLYVAIGAHTDKKTGIPGEDSKNVMSAVEMLRAIGDDIMPDFAGKRVVVIGGGNVAMDVTRSSVRLGAASIAAELRICPRFPTRCRAQLPRVRRSASFLRRCASRQTKRARLPPSGCSRRSSALPTSPADPARTRQTSPKNAFRLTSSSSPSGRAWRSRALSRPVSPSKGERLWLKAPARSTTWKTSLPAATA